MPLSENLLLAATCSKLFIHGILSRMIPRQSKTSDRFSGTARNEFPSFLSKMVQGLRVFPYVQTEAGGKFVSMQLRTMVTLIVCKKGEGTDC